MPTVGGVKGAEVYVVVDVEGKTAETENGTATGGPVQVVPLLTWQTEKVTGKVPKVRVNDPVAVALSLIVTREPLSDVTSAPGWMPVPLTASPGTTPGKPPTATARLAVPASSVTSGMTAPVSGAGRSPKLPTAVASSVTAVPTVTATTEGTLTNRASELGAAVAADSARAWWRPATLPSTKRRSEPTPAMSAGAAHGRKATWRTSL